MKPKAKAALASAMFVQKVVAVNAPVEKVVQPSDEREIRDIGWPKAAPTLRWLSFKLHTCVAAISKPVWDLFASSLASIKSSAPSNFSQHAESRPTIFSRSQPTL